MVEPTPDPWASDNQLQDNPSDPHAGKQAPVPRRTVGETLGATILLAMLGLFLGSRVQGLISWEHATTDPYEGMGRGLLSIALAPLVIVPVTLIAFRVARVHLWAVAGLAAISLSIVSARIAEPLVAATPVDSPVVWPWCAALAYAGSALFFQLVRRPIALLALAPVVLGLSVLSAVGTERKRDQWQAKAAASIRATELPVLTTDIAGYAPSSASAGPTPIANPAGRDIIQTFRPDPPSDKPYLDASVTMRIFPRPATFQPPEACTTTGHSTLPPEPCTEIAPGIWWSDSEHAAIREHDQALVILSGDSMDPQPKDALVAAAERIRPTTVDDLVSHNR